jgi:predicted regulator of Ras-like GTPase activity (Roadblock/LC7/MglB family)
MKLPFLRFFKKAQASEPVVAATVPRPVVTIEKPASERFAKTFTPNMTHKVVVEAPRAYAPAGVGADTIAPPSPAVLPSFSPGSSLPASALVPPPPPRPLVSKGDAPRILLTEPDISTVIAERTISLQLSEISLPEGILNSDGLDPERRVLFKAADLERGMSSGKPSIKLRAIYQQAPEFFAREIAGDDPMEVALPFGKVLEQFASFQVRPDQIIEETLPQVDTPFLQVTLEDNERFGSPIVGTPISSSAPAPRPIEIPELAPVDPIDPDASIRPTVPTEATQSAAASAGKPIRLSSTTSPDPAAAPAIASGAPPPAKAPIRLSSTTLPDPAPIASAAPVTPALPVTPVIPVPPAVPIAPATAAPAVPSAPGAAVTSKISPNGTGVPAPERVPASSGSPVPTPFPSPFAPPPASPKTPARVKIPPKIGPPSNDLRESRPLRIPISKSDGAKVQFSNAGPRIRLPLRSILRGVAPCQLSGPTDEVAEDAVIELPFAIVEPQLSLGKISISPAQFHSALPDKYRNAFAIQDEATPIGLPLQEVLANLPNDSLRIRHDQETDEVLPNFETPFSLKAAEDAARLKAPGAPPDTTTKDAPVEAAPIQPAAKKSREPKIPQAELPSQSTFAPIPATSPVVPPQAVAPSAAAAPVRLAAPTPAVASAPGVAPKSITSPAAAVPPAKPARDPLQLVFDTDETMDAKNVVAHTSRLPGVRACAIFFSDGLSLAGNIPSEFKIDPLCAVAPALVRKCHEQMASANLGTFAGLTLSCTKSAVTFFAHGDICFAALHWAGQEIEIATRTRLCSVTTELARTYSQPTTVSA